VAKGLSQEPLGFAAELDRTFISQVERSGINVSLDNIERGSIRTLKEIHTATHPARLARSTSSAIEGMGEPPGEGDVGDI